MYDSKYFVILCMVMSKIISTQDVNLSMYMYLANHLTFQECLKLTTYLYVEDLELTTIEDLSKYKYY